MPEEKNRRLVLDGDIIYPITRQENIIGLQKTIKEKLPIISANTPESQIERQVWLDIAETENIQIAAFTVNNLQNVGELPPNEEITQPWVLPEEEENQFELPPNEEITQPWALSEGEEK